MEDLAQNILNIIKDYRNDDGIQRTLQDILDWASQFGEDSKFILSELNHILPQVYLSKEKAKLQIKNHIIRLMGVYQYTSLIHFLQDTEFLDMQKANKSQKKILELLDDILQEEYQDSYKNYLTYPKKNFVYFDDVLATGGTIRQDLIKWLQTLTNTEFKHYELLLRNEYKLSVELFCTHTWGQANLIWALKQSIATNIDSKIRWYRDYEIQNHLGELWKNPNLNVAIPIEDQPQNVKAYLANLAAKAKENFAYRKHGQPNKEVFFTNPQNRIRYENILLQKGIEIIQQIKGEIKSNIRPLGLILPSYRTFGLGTHFFTWRNIPNNAPLVFWWEVPTHDWKPLFPVANRGL